jgi:hypothetical protein
MRFAYCTLRELTTNKGHANNIFRLLKNRFVKNLSLCFLTLKPNTDDKILSIIIKTFNSHQRAARFKTNRISNFEICFHIEFSTFDA